MNTIRPLSRPSLRRLLFKPSRPSSSKPSPPPSATTPPSSAITRLHARTPRFLRPYLTPLLSAPLSSVTSFLILHELTALVPLAGIFAYLHYSAADAIDAWVAWVRDRPAFAEGVERWGRYARRKGWVGPSSDDEVQQPGEGGVPRVVLELAVAWAVTKVLLPLRIVGSVWATPWFATRVVVPVTTAVRRVVRRT